MGFAALPSSPGFQLPQAPRWEGFAEKAIDLIANRKIPDTAAMVDKAADQINNILKLHSPEARAERQLKMLQLGAMKGVWSDFQAHPEKYQMTAHGPVLIDVLARSERMMNIRSKAEAIKTSIDKRTHPTAAPIQFVQNADKNPNIVIHDVGQPDEKQPLPGSADQQQPAEQPAEPPSDLGTPIPVGPPPVDPDLEGVPPG